jgi:hypothetical protein
MDNLSINPFGIQDTMEMGMGNAQLLNDLLSPETASGSPDDVEPIINEANPPEAPEAPAKPKGKEILPKNPDAKKDENEQPDGQSLISSFLGNNNDDDDEEDTPASEPDKPEAKQEQVNEENNEEDASQSKFAALANDLVRLGVFSMDEDEESINVSTPEEFLERFQMEKRKGAQEAIESFLGQFGEDYRNAFDAIYVKGVDPKEYFGTYNTIVNFAELDLSQEDNQVRVMRQALADQGFDSEDIDTEIERLKNYGDLESVSGKHHKVLVRKEAQKLQQMEAQAEQELRQKATVRNQYIQNVQGVLQEKMKTKEFDGIPMNPKLANELQDFLLVEKWKTQSGETLTDFDKTILDLKRPENHAMKVKVGLLLKILEKDPTLSTIQKTGVSKKTDQLFSEVARQVERTKSGTSTKTQKPNSWFL